MFKRANASRSKQAREGLPRIARIVRRNGLTFLSRARLQQIVDTIDTLKDRGVQGCYIEAGCALGGCSIVIAQTRPHEAPFYVYDVFGMIPPPGEKDADDAHERFEVISTGQAKGLQNGTYYGYVDDLYSVVQNNIAEHTSPSARKNLHLVKGLLQDTMQLTEDVAFAHIDVDWYDPVMTSLERISARLVPGGAIVVDDYADWDGCRSAVDDFLATTSMDFDVDNSATNLKLTRRS